MTMPQKILIIRLSSLGDILHALPAVRSLRSAFPLARIDWLVERRIKTLLPPLPGVDEVLVLDTGAWRKKPWSRATLSGLRTLIRTLRRNDYDLSLDFQGLLKTGLLSFLSGARCRMGFSKNLVRERPAHWFYHRVLDKPKEELHVARLNLELALAAGGSRIPLHTELSASEEDWQTIESRLAEEQLSQYVIINPGGNWPTKRWKTANYAELADRIRLELLLRVIVTTGPEEGHLYTEIREGCATAPPAHFPVSFAQLIPLCLKARLFVGGDTGPFHLACALGTPTVGIFGPTSPVRNGPLSPQDRSVFHKLHCSFCYGRTCPTQNECMDIGVDEVFEAVVQRLRGGKSQERRIIA